MSRVAVIGAGYVGLTTSAFLAHLGHDVRCADVVPEKVAQLEQGQVPIVEEGLEELVREGLDRGRLRFVLGAPAAVQDCEFTFLCLPTPERPDGSADMSHVLDVATQIGRTLESGSIVVNKSTVPVGSTHVVQRAIARPDVAVVSNPEFLREGSALRDCLHPDRIVIGSTDEAAAIRLAGLYGAVAAPIMVTDPASAETIKYASNAFLATKVSFINAMANLCEAVGADVKDVILGMGYDRRIGFEFLKPGPGWGGSCLPKDTSALVRIGEDAGYDFGLLRGVIAINEEQQGRVVAKVTELAGGRLEGATVAVWGLTFKAGTDDRRNSPAVAIARRLTRAGARVQAYDPTVRRPLPEVEFCLDAYAACEGASVLAVLTEWDEFRWVDLAKVRSLMARPAVVDARNMLDPAAVRLAGFNYAGIGRQ